MALKVTLSTCPYTEMVPTCPKWHLGEGRLAEPDRLAEGEGITVGWTMENAAPLPQSREILLRISPKRLTEAIGPFLITDLRGGMVDARAQEVEHVIQLVHRDA